MAIKSAKYKILNSNNEVDIYHFQTNADLVIDGTTKKVPLKTEIDRWNSISFGGRSIFISSIQPTAGETKAGDLWFQLI
jgi:hypothetical protein